MTKKIKYFRRWYPKVKFSISPQAYNRALQGLELRKRLSLLLVEKLRMVNGRKLKKVKAPKGKNNL